MARKIILSFLLALLVFGVNAQEKQNKHERIVAQKAAFITERLDLYPTEAQQFWPVYNAYEKEMKLIRRNDMSQVRKAMKKGDELTESEAKATLNKFMEVQDKIHLQKKKLVEDLKGILPPQKIIALKVAEDAFNKRLFELLKEKRGGGKDRPKN